MPVLPACRLVLHGTTIICCHCRAICKAAGIILAAFVRLSRVPLLFWCSLRNSLSPSPLSLLPLSLLSSLLSYWYLSWYLTWYSGTPAAAASINAALPRMYATAACVCTHAVSIPP